MSFRSPASQASKKDLISQAADAVDGLLDHLLRVVVQGTGGFIQEEEGGLRTCGFPKGVN